MAVIPWFVKLLAGGLRRPLGFTTWVTDDWTLGITRGQKKRLSFNSALLKLE